MSTDVTPQTETTPQKGFLAWVESAGNKLPDPTKRAGP